jgi:hypothetical protein
MRVRAILSLSGFVAVVAAAACGSDSDNSPKITLTGAKLQDPNNCLPCHADQFREWSGSMHAYASADPVFRAMNKRMLRETNNANPNFCVNCHAPVAVRLGLTTDGSNLDTLPTSVQGITCFFCHTTDSVTDAHNNPLHLANDDTFRGGIKDPAKSMPHKGIYSPLHDRDQPQAATLCGACHDVVTPHGAPVERTFDEWKNSLYSQPVPALDTCGKCHMEGRDGKAAQTAADAPIRRVHDHSMAAVDIALTPFFGSDVQKAAVQTLLDNTILTQLCVMQTPTQGVVATVNLDNAFAGHGFPSGAAQDRRVWVELIATKGAATIFSSGTVGDKQAATAFTDPNYWLLRDTIFDDANKETHLFWQAARFTSEQLSPAVTSDPLNPAFIHSKTHTYPLPDLPDKVSMRVRMRPLDFDLLDDLVQSGDLDPTVRDAAPVFDMASGTKAWTSADGLGKCIK